VQGLFWYDAFFLEVTPLSKSKMSEKDKQEAQRDDITEVDQRENFEENAKNRPLRDKGILED